MRKSGSFFAPWFVCVLFISFVLAHVVSAQAEEAAPPAQQQADSKCAASTLTQEQFLDMLDAIVKHGDMVDVPFIEKTLQTKFREQDPRTTGEPPPNKRYLFDAVLGAPVGGSLGVLFNAAEFEKGKEPRLARVGDLDFTLYSLNPMFPLVSAFTDCQRLKAKQIDQKFGGGFMGQPVDQIDTGIADRYGYTRCKALPATSYGPINLTYFFDKNTEAVREISLSNFGHCN